MEASKKTFYNGYDEKSDVRYKVIKNNAWRSDYVFISRLHWVFTFGFLITGIVLYALCYTVWIESKDQLKLEPLAFTCLFYSIILFLFSRYCFLSSRFFTLKNEYLNQAIKSSSLKYDKALWLKYLSIIIYQFCMFTPFFYSIFYPTGGDAGGVKIALIIFIFYLAWIFLVLVDYINVIKISDKEEHKHKLLKQIIGFFLYAFFWTFMIKGEDYLVYSIESNKSKKEQKNKQFINNN